MSIPEFCGGITCWCRTPRGERDRWTSRGGDAATAVAALGAIVTAWDADWGRVYDWDYKNPVANPPQGQHPPPFWSGRIVYLASRFADRIVPPPPMRSQAFAPIQRMVQRLL